MKIPQTLVTRYAKLSALKNLLDKWLEQKREEIRLLFEKGYTCPDRGPFLLELGDAKDRPDWKEEFSRHLFKEYAEAHGEETAGRMVESYFAEVLARDRDKSPRLYSKRNPNYRKKFPIRLPA
jgi:hypothetical protein